ncbi:Maf family protein [Sphingomonas sinipercae]|uniref:Maf family protein n=1 Tax=Sphingomonas sinipercae TaxID=2714944 RepID=UPI0024840404|nr:nucleoside triphosphate pyrophosphatase [Sphingomonas sinipercae]
MFDLPLILASTSPIRQQMLAQAGVSFLSQAAAIDEAVEKAAHRGDPSLLAEHLAGLKAQSVSVERPDDWVAGSDSVVTVAGRRFDKAADREQAADHLRFFSGKALKLTSAVALARGGQIDWSVADVARLQVRTLSDAFIEDYLDAEWPEVAYCVGVFRLEGPGVQLFESIEGSYFTVLGMPLLPLLGALRDRGVMQA